MRVKGLHEHRFPSNPEEQRFAEAWTKCDGSGKQLDVRRFQGGCPPQVEDRDRVVAATVIQWLGYPVGQAFLRDLGYERKT